MGRAGEGMSTRAIAPIVGTSHQSVANDLSRVKKLTPAPTVNTETGEVSDDNPSTDVTTGGEVTPAAPAVTGQGAPAVFCTLDHLDTLEDGHAVAAELARALAVLRQAIEGQR